MVVSRTERVSRVVLAVALGLLVLLRLPRLVDYNPVPWAWIAAFALGAGLLFGPVTWAARERLPAERREWLGLVAAGVALAGLPVVVGLGLVSGNLLLVLDAGIVGAIAGFAVAVLAERTGVPERLRGTGQ